jgi:hypothetical protein
MWPCPSGWHRAGLALRQASHPFFSIPGRADPLLPTVPGVWPGPLSVRPAGAAVTLAPSSISDSFWQWPLFSHCLGSCNQQAPARVRCLSEFGSCEEASLGRLDFARAVCEVGILSPASRKVESRGDQTDNTCKIADRCWTGSVGAIPTFLPGAVLIWCLLWQC